MYTVKGITWRADIGGLTQSQNTKYMIGNMKIESCQMFGNITK